MKKKLLGILLGTFVIVTMIVLVGCDKVTPEKRVASAKDEVTVSSSVTADITLPATYGDVTIKWSSDKPEFISDAGKVVRPTFTQGDVIVTLTATFTYKSASDTKAYTVTVVKQDESDGEKLDAAKAAKVKIITDAFETYAEDDYAETKWAELVQIKDDAILEINALTVIAEAEGYDTAAILTAMSEVIADTSDFFEGVGTESNPYRIETAEQLECFAEAINEGYTNLMDCLYNDADTYYVLSADIELNDLTGVSEWGDEPPVNSWIPIGCDEDFVANFDGQNHTVSGIYIDDEDWTFMSIGFFGAVTSNTVQNLTIKDSFIKGSSMFGVVGGIAGWATDSVISDCHVEDSYIIGGEEAGSVGGIVGMADSSEITDCSNSGEVKTFNEWASFGAVGGIAGTLLQSSVINSDNSGMICAEGVAAAVGGIAGNAQALNGDNYITGCDNSGSITVADAYGGQYVGGIVGQITGASLSIAYFCTAEEVETVTVSASGNVNIYIDDCNNTGDIVVENDDAVIGGIAGQMVCGTVIHKYYIDMDESEVLGGGIDPSEVEQYIVDNRITDCTSTGDWAQLGKLVNSEVRYEGLPEEN